MGNFKSNNRSGFQGRSSGSRFGGDRGRFGRGRNFERSRGRNSEMYDAVCSKCGKRCQIPFKPTGSKPVFCSDCFKQGNSSGNNFSPRNQPNSSQSEAYPKQLAQINAKLDKILGVLQELELDVDEDFDEGEDDIEDEEYEEDDEETNDEGNEEDLEEADNEETEYEVGNGKEDNENLEEERYEDENDEDLDEEADEEGDDSGEEDSKTDSWAI